MKSNYISNKKKYKKFKIHSEKTVKNKNYLTIFPKKMD